ncbi:MAG: CRISPR-associated protein Cas4 [Thermoplasmata archaeon]|nr:CRISPR-associated protein Cas4 [Thermoplasmata archaeon]
MNYYSYSAISKFKNCPLHFRYSYIDRIKPLRRTIEAFMGSRVHETLEKLYRDKLYAKTDTLEELLSFYNERWNREMKGNIFVVKDYDMDNYRRMGEIYITDYYNTYKPFDEGKTIALEKKLNFPIDDRYWITGIVDRITEVDGVYEVHDYKTSLYLPSRHEIDETQLAIYALAINHHYGVENIELVWHYLAFNKEIRIRKDSYEHVREEVIKSIEEIEEAISNDEFPPKESQLCNYCEYQPICPLFRHKYELDEMDIEEIENEDGFMLVNKYWEIEQKISELQARKEEIKKRLVEYARKKKINHVYGSEKMANIKFYRNFNMNDETGVAEVLKKHGLYEKYTRIDKIAVSKALEAGIMPPEVAKEIMKYIEEKEVVRIYLRNLSRRD